MGAEKNQTIRKPLSDCTNNLTSSIIKPTKLSVSSAINKLPNPNPKPISKSKTNSSVGFTQNRQNDNVQNPSAVTLVALASTPSRPHNNSSVSGTGDCEVFEPHTVYSRRQFADKGKSKGKAVAVPLSCSPAERICNIVEKKTAEGDIGQSKLCTDPPKKKPRHTVPEQDASEHSLKDYIVKQRAYFAEVDAFELPEEEVSSAQELE